MSAPLQKLREPTIPPAPGSCPLIETRRLVLRQHRIEDADPIAASLGDFAVARMLTRVPVPYDRQDALDWLNTVTSGLKPDWSFALTTGDDVHIGVVSLELRHGLWQLGYWLNRFYWGKGLMSEATSAVLDRFFRRMPDAELAAGAFADNPASFKVLEKLGGTITGVSDVYSLSRNAMAPMIDMRLTQSGFASRNRDR
jgi:RimJ/RimL family protein N-acetyltransferase